MRADTKHCNQCIYIHIDPGTRELLYIGSTCDMRRPYHVYGRSPEHRARIFELEAQGWSRKQIARVVAQGISYPKVRTLEGLAIEILRPRFNRTHNSRVGLSQVQS